jgi:hypothetical protein
MLEHLEQNFDEIIAGARAERAVQRAITEHLQVYLSNFLVTVPNYQKG